MTVAYVSSLKTTRMNSVITAIDAAVGNGYIEIGTAGMALVLVTIAFQKPSFTESGGVITMAGAPKSGIATGTGTAAAARIRTSVAADVITGLTVGVSGSDINLNSTSITTGQTVTLTSGTITHG